MYPTYPTKLILKTIEKWEILKKQTTTECSLNPTCPSGTREIKTESCTLPP